MSDSKSSGDSAALVHGVVHTPGPWEVGKYMGLPTIFDTRGNGTVALASVHDMAIESADVNAALMAEAPEMLKIVATIATATGDTDLEYVQVLANEIIGRLKAV